MNRRLHRLVYSRRHRMLVAVAEHARANGSAARGRRREGHRVPLATALAAALLAGWGHTAWAQTAPVPRPPVVFGSRLAPLAAARNLPVISGPNNAIPRTSVYDPARGAGSADLLAGGQVAWTRSGNTATFDQKDQDRVVINWDSFDIGAGYKVVFRQKDDPTRYVSALNRIWSADPSVILGSLVANREVILLNGNGVYFGRGARVDTGKFVASTLNIADSVFERGLRNVTNGSAVFGTAGTDGYSATNLDSAVSVEQGAELRSAAGGDVLLFAPRVVNQGRIETPAGQTVLGAGGSVYLMSSADPAQRGLIVAVDPVLLAGGTNVPDPTLGIVENAATGSYRTVNGATVPDGTPDATAGLVNRLNEIRAESGTVNLVGLTVRQNGVINATTAVKGANGAIWLQAMASTASVNNLQAAARGLGVDTAAVRVGRDLGTVTIGAVSRTAVTPDGGAATQIDADRFNPSRIHVEGQAIAVEGGAVVSAPSGRIELLAAAQAVDGSGNPTQPFQAARNTTLPLLPDDGSRIVVAPGASLSAAGLADVAVDGARNQGSQRLFRIELADAPVQRSGPLYRAQVLFDLREAASITAANVGGAAAAVGRTAQELSTAGGAISLLAQGTVVLGTSAGLDVSGGSVRYSQAVIRNSLLTRDGRVIGFRVLGAGRAADILLAAPQAVVSPAYTEGKAGGTLTIDARSAAVADAVLKGTVVQGERQRDGTSPRPAPAALVLGLNEDDLGALRLLPEGTAGLSTAYAAALVDDPLHAPLSGVPAATVVSLKQLRDAGFRNVALRASDITQPLHGTLDLGAGGALTLQSGGALSLDGSFSAAGGSLQVSGLRDTTLSATTRLDAAGLWTNDLVAAGAAGDAQAGLAPVQPGGGAVAVASTQSTLTLRAGAVLDVSAGAWLNSAGTLKQGSAGAITLAGNRVAPSGGAGPATWSGVQLRGYDFSGGGKLDVKAQDLTLTAGAPGPGFTLDPGFFSAGGFGSIAITTLGSTTDRGDVVVGSGTRLAPMLLNWDLGDGFRAVASGAMAQAATPRAVDLQQADRAPVNVALNAARPLVLDGVTGAAGSSLVVERGASIELEPGASLVLSATRGLEVGARGGSAGQAALLSAPGGRLDLSVVGVRGTTDGTDRAGFIGDQALWLGNDALLSASGTARLRPATTPVAADAAGVPRLAGRVLGGGSVTLNAQRGYVVAEAGSSIALDGATAPLTLPGLADPVQVSRPAGSLAVSSPEGVVLDGRISAQAPRDAAGRALADGGSLAVNLGTGGLLTGVVPSARSYFDDPDAGMPALRSRTVSVGEHDGLLARRAVVRGGDLSQTLGNGVAYVRRSMLQAGGWSALTLGAGDGIRFDTSLSLDLPLGLRLNAPALVASPGVQVDLRTAYAQLGDAAGGRNGRPALSRAALADSRPATPATLRVRAPTIEVYGDWGLQGWSRTLLDAGGAAGGEIRLSSASEVRLTQPTLAFAGTLELAAAQTYATSSVLYGLQGLTADAANGAGSTLLFRTGAGGVAPQAPLSAFGALRASATTIEQQGVLRQPFGSISLAASGLLTLGAGSITSVSGAGATVPYSTTTNLSTWNSGLAALPAKAIALSADRLVTDASATVDASGGGRVIATEFFPGVGGSRDYTTTAGLYAVLPDYAAAQALKADVGKLDAAQQGREIVITMPGSGLAPGRYTLMPAAYALIGGALPQGAYMVSRAADQGRSLLSQPVRQDDGSTVVTGYVTQAGSINVGLPGERYVVEPAATYNARSDIRRTDVSDLLLGNAQALGSTVRPAVPRDAGQVQVQVQVTGSERATWQARLDLAAAGGQAGLLDFSATRLALVDDPAKTPAGTLGIATASIAGSGAGSVLVGGRRSLSVGSSDAAVPAYAIDNAGTRTVTVDAGTQPLQVEELLLTAREGVTLSAGTTLAAATTATLGARTLNLGGDGALVGISANALDVRRDAGSGSGAGRVELGAGTTLAGRSVVLDAAGTVQAPGSTRLQARALSLGARRLVLGEGAAPDVAASTFAGSLLTSVLDTPDLTLRGYDGIDFVGVQNWSQRPSQAGAAPASTLDRLVIDTPLLRGVQAQAGGSVRTDIAALDIQLRNTTGRDATASAASSAGSGELVLQALPPLRYGSTGGLALGPGNLSLGYGSATLRSTGDLLLQGSGSLQAQQDLTLSAARLTAADAAVQSVAAPAGLLRVAAEAGSRTLGERAGVGAEVRLAGATLQQQGRIDLPGGQLTLASTGVDALGVGIALGVGSVTSVAGFTVGDANDLEAYVRAGSITATAVRGRIEALGTVDAGAALRADGSRGLGDAGSVTLRATGSGGALVLSGTQADGTPVQGRLQAQAGSGPDDRGGLLAVDVATMLSADALAAAAVAGGMTREVNVRVRSGNLALNAGLDAQRILLSADAGSLNLGGTATLDASAAAGGLVQLAAGGDLVLGAGTRIDARSTRAGANGGDVLLASGSGRVRLAAGATVDASGDDAKDGRIVLRALRGADNRSVAVDALDTTRLVAAEVDVEAVRRHANVTTVTTGTGTGATLGQTTVHNDSVAFMNNAGTVLSGLRVPAGEAGRVNLRAGVEITSSGNLTVAADWLLNNARPGGDAGFLTLRATGNLVFNGSVSDGFNTRDASGNTTGTPTASATAGIPNANARSWSYRYAAGADLAAANPLGVTDLSTSAVETGNLTIAGGRVLRTGAGSIELAAGRDVLFSAGLSGGTQGIAYVGGRQATELRSLLAGLFAGHASANKPVFTEQGGRMEVLAQRDVVSAAPRQLIGNWLWRTGLTAASGLAYSSQSQAAWWPEFTRYAQTLGSMGGGNLTVRAGRDVRGLQAMVPTSAWADSPTLAQARLQVRNGADLSIEAGRDVLGGQYLLGSGSGHLRAGRNVAPDTTAPGLTLPVLGLMDGRWDVAARGSLAMGPVLDPTATAPTSGDARITATPYYYSWGADAGLTLNATAGNVLLDVTFTAAANYGLANTSARLYGVLPPSLSLQAPAGNVSLLGGSADAILFPSARGNLQAWAGGDLSLPRTLAMSDAAPTAWPSWTSGVSPNALPTFDSALLVPTLSGTLAGTALHASDPNPVQLHAEGSIVGSAGGALRLPKSANVSAGEDIAGLTLVGQHQQAGDLTRISAGRNLLQGNNNATTIAIAGPGVVELTAGRQLDLGGTAGVVTTGNATNPTLPAQGASVRMTAAAHGTLNLQVLQSYYLDAARNPRAADHRERLLAYVRAAVKQPALDYAQALSLFGTFPAAAQAELGRQLLAAEFSAVYLLATPPTAAQMTARLREAFQRHQAEVLKTGEEALAAGGSLTLPGREVLSGAALAAYVADLRGLSFSAVDIDAAVAARVTALQQVRQGWRDTVAAGLGSSAAALDALLRDAPQSAAARAWQDALQDTGSARFQAYRSQVLARETASAGAIASQYGRKALPMRLAFFDQGFAAAELAGAGSFVQQPIWSGSDPLLARTGTLNMTQSGVITQRGGDIALVAAGGAVNVGLKKADGDRARGVIALGGGDIFGYARDDFQVNDQRVFIVGSGDMNIWSSRGDIDSGRGANTAVAAPPLAARRTADGVRYEALATTTGSGLGILEDASGRRAGTIGLFPAFGEILALDAFIRAPAVVLGATVRGADNLQAASVGGAAAPVSAPVLAVSAPPPSSETRAATTQATAAGSETRPRNSLLTVDLLGMGPEPAGAEAPCSEQDEREQKCRRPAPPRCTAEQKAAGNCR